MTGVVDTEVENTEDEFDSAFAEFSGIVKEEEEVGNEDSASEEEVAEETGEDEKSVDKSEENKDNNNEESTDSDEFDKVPDSVKQKLDKFEDERRLLRQQVQSEKGRAKAHQKQVDELKQKIANLEATTAKASNMTPAEWDEFKTTYPQMAAQMEAFVNHRLEQETSVLKAENSKLKQQLEPLTKSQSDIEEEAAKLDVAAAHSDYVEIIKTNEFYDWLDARPVAIQNMFDSPVAEDAIELLNMYKQSHPDKFPPPSKSSSEPSKKAAELEKKREQQLRTAAKVKSNDGPPSTDTADDFDAAFAAFAAKADKRSK